MKQLFPLVGLFFLSATLTASAQFETTFRVIGLEETSGQRNNRIFVRMLRLTERLEHIANQETPNLEDFQKIKSELTGAYEAVKTNLPEKVFYLKRTEAILRQSEPKLAELRAARERSEAHRSTWKKILESIEQGDTAAVGDHLPMSAPIPAVQPKKPNGPFALEQSCLASLGEEHDLFFNQIKSGLLIGDETIPGGALVTSNPPGEARTMYVFSESGVYKLPIDGEAAKSCTSKIRGNENPQNYLWPETDGHGLPGGSINTFQHPDKAVRDAYTFSFVQIGEQNPVYLSHGQSYSGEAEGISTLLSSRPPVLEQKNTAWPTTIAHKPTPPPRRTPVEACKAKFEKPEESDRKILHDALAFRIQRYREKFEAEKTSAQIRAVNQSTWIKRDISKNDFDVPPPQLPNPQTFINSLRACYKIDNPEIRKLIAAELNKFEGKGNIEQPVGDQSPASSIQAR